MNSDNPYAAPQTIEPQSATTLLPVAEGQGDPPQRRMFVDWDTARLKALWKCSGAINDTQVVWLVLCFASPFLAGAISLPFFYNDSAATNLAGLVALAWIVLTFVRFGTGFTRSEPIRIFALIMDGLLVVICLVAIIGSFVLALYLAPEAAVLLIFMLPVCTLCWIQAVRSLRAMLIAPELYGPERIPHDALGDEVEYREQHQID